MSTKIYNAWKIDPVKPDDIGRMMRNIRTYVRQQAANHPRFIRLTDKVTAAADYVVSMARGIISGEHGTFSSSAVLYTHESEGFLIQYFGLERQAAYHAAVLTRTTLRGREFDWQNQTDDLPDGVGEAEYADRERVWDEILGDDGVPDRHGFVFDFLTKEDELAIMFSELRGLWIVPQDERAVRDWAFMLSRDAMRLMRAGRHDEFKERLVGMMLLGDGTPFTDDRG